MVDMNTKKDNQLRKLGFLPSFTIYIVAAILMYVMTNYLIPFLSKETGQEIILFWFIIGILGVFLPIIIMGIIILKNEGYNISKDTWINRLRFKKITKKVLIWSIGGMVAVAVFSGITMKILEHIIGEFDHSPSFMVFEPLSSGRYWLLAIWFIYWIFNILGEEFVWRGVMLPRQEITFGKYAWLIHGFGWALFHIAFGWQLMITLIPIIFIQSYIVQKTKNSWVGIIMHGGINGPAFIAISFGLI